VVAPSTLPSVAGTLVLVSVDAVASGAATIRRAGTAWSLTVFNLAMFAGFAVIFYSSITPPALLQSGGGAVTGFYVFPFAPFAIVGGVIAARRPRHPIGWLLLMFSTLYILGVQCALIGSLLVYWHNPAAPWVLLGSALWNAPVLPSVIAMLVLVLIFPDGRLRSPRWRLLIYAEAVLVLTGIVICVVNPMPGALGITTATSNPALVTTSPLAIPGAAGTVEALTTVWSLAHYPLLVAALVCLLLRLRDADSDRRHQIRWFAFGTVVTVGLIALASALPTAIFSGSDALTLALVGPLLFVGGLALPVSIAVAVLKYRLYDIDVVISRTLVYGTLAVFITAVYIGIAVGIGALIGGGGKPNLGLSILATAIVAVGFQPVRERVQRVANRLVYGKRATPYEVLSQFSERVAESYATDDVMPRMARVLAEGTGAQRADVWLRQGTTWRDAAVWPVDAAPADPIAALNGELPSVSGAGRLVEVRHQGDLLGALGVTKRSGETLTPVEENLLSHLAGQAGLVLKNVGLTGDLQARLEELRASRQRLVTAQDEERRRLERNLHDGAQQHLVALKVKLGLAEMLLSRDPEKAKATLEQLKGDADEALETLRDLARGIYPPLLADKGLTAALESQARKATVPVTVDADGVGRYSQDVEAAVYFCCLEALQNVQKYAQATRATVTLREVDDTLRFSIADEGVGFDVAATPKGSGLANMVDRFDALGGEIEVTSVPGRGTTVGGVLQVVTAVSG
jgi:signal transduction histidine kinase